MRRHWRWTEPPLLFAAAVILIIILCLLAPAGCRCPTPATPVVKPIPTTTIVRTWSACLENPPPEAAAFAPLPAGDPQCPFAACLERDAAVALITYLDDLETWARTAWARCNNAPKETL